MGKQLNNVCWPMALCQQLQNNDCGTRSKITHQRDESKFCSLRQLPSVIHSAQSASIDDQQGPLISSSAMHGHQEVSPGLLTSLSLHFF